MCGIAGMIHLQDASQAAPPGAVARMAHAIIHRGPDEEGFLERPGFSWGSRRLSIVGLADGQQPIANEDGSVWTVFNGELFDYPEKRTALESLGHQFRTHTDTELIPHLWEEYGEDMWPHLSGQFAFCLWDRQQHLFVLARDRAGICPLFYTMQWIDGAPWLLFASELKALLASGYVVPKMNPAGINHIFSFFAMPGPATVFAGISLLLPGRYLAVRPHRDFTENRLIQRIYWQVDYPQAGQEEWGADAEATIDGFEDVLQRAVAKRLRADVPVVSYLSGGVDSSLVVAMACKALGRALPTFTVGVQAPGMNEESEALQTAQHLGCTPTVVPCSDADLRRDYPELIRVAEFPVIDTACLGLMHLARAVHNAGYKVALTGEGADEWLAGYPWFKIHRLTSFLDRGPASFLGYWLRTLTLKLTGQPTPSRQSIDHVRQLLGGHNGWIDVYGMMSLNKFRFFTGELRQFALSHSPYDDLELPAELHQWHRFHRQMYLGARIMLPGHLLASKGDRVAMHSSVETRYPFLDEDVIAYMAKLHPRWKLRGLLQDKYIERCVAQRWLPKHIAWRRKLMFRAPMDSWAKVDSTEPWIDQVLSPESLQKTGYFDVQAVLQARQRLPELGRRSVNRTSLAMGLTAVTATQLWHHLYLGGQLCDLPGAS